MYKELAKKKLESKKIIKTKKKNPSYVRDDFFRRGLAVLFSSSWKTYTRLPPVRRAPLHDKNRRTRKTQIAKWRQKKNDPGKPKKRKMNIKNGNNQSIKPSIP
jgi:hypothetical protein